MRDLPASFQPNGKWIAASVKHIADAIDETTVIQLMEPNGSKKLQNEQRDRHELLHGKTLARPCELYTTWPLREVKSRHDLTTRFGHRGPERADQAVRSTLCICSPTDINLHRRAALRGSAVACASPAHTCFEVTEYSRRHCTMRLGE